MRRARRARRRQPADAVVVAEITVDGEHEFYDFEAKYLPEEHTALDVPADLPDDVADADPGAAVRAFEALSAARAWPGWTSSCSPDGAVVINEVNTMPGLHAVVDVPADVGGDRAGLPRARRPADPARAAPRHRAALSRAGRQRQGRHLADRRFTAAREVDHASVGRRRSSRRGRRTSTYGARPTVVIVTSVGLVGELRRPGRTSRRR